MVSLTGAMTSRFLSTPSARRATEATEGLLAAVRISIHALREEGDVQDIETGEVIQISIHALREEGDTRTTPTLCTISYFYPRPPRGGRHTHQSQRRHTT